MHIFFLVGSAIAFDRHDCVGIVEVICIFLTCGIVNCRLWIPTRPREAPSQWSTSLARNITASSRQRLASHRFYVFEDTFHICFEDPFGHSDPDPSSVPVPTVLTWSCL
jgi:hypothetical protein